jgi:hypothetical protein
VPKPDEKKDVKAEGKYHMYDGAGKELSVQNTEPEQRKVFSPADQAAIAPQDNNGQPFIPDEDDKY